MSLNPTERPLGPSSERSFSVSESLIFSASLAQRSTLERLAPTYVGVRRIRPSSKAVRQAVQQEALGIDVTIAPLLTPPNYDGVATTTASTVRSNPLLPPNNVKFVVHDPVTGVERRMTAQEKKTLKRKLQLERERQRKEIRRTVVAERAKMQEDGKREGVVAVLDSAVLSAEPHSQANSDSGVGRESNDTSTNVISDMEGDGNLYYPLHVDPSALREELADIRGKREGVPPVALSRALTRQALLQGTLTSGNNDIDTRVLPWDAVFDAELSASWALLLKESMKPAEELRDQEVHVRAMPYVLEPEAWTRLRPPHLGAPVQGVHSLECQRPPSPTLPSSNESWSFCHIRDPQLQSTDRCQAEEAIVQLLYQGTSFHMSCGAKFGCDYLIYQGSRQEHHAFAGLRVIHQDHHPGECREGSMPLPTAYDLTGYVRGLNTAGKLALLATVSKREETLRVAIVDLALKKVRATTFRGASGKITPKMLPKRL